jgi:hypothetical protein
MNVSLSQISHQTKIPIEIVAKAALKAGVKDVADVHKELTLDLKDLCRALPTKYQTHLDPEATTIAGLRPPALHLNEPEMIEREPEEPGERDLEDARLLGGPVIDVQAVKAQATRQKATITHVTTKTIDDGIAETERSVEKARKEIPE